MTDENTPGVWPAFAAFFAAVAGLMVGGMLVTAVYVGLMGPGPVDETIKRVAGSAGYLIWITVVSNVVFGCTALVAARLEGQPILPRLSWPWRAGARRSVFMATLLLSLGISEAGDRVVALLRLDLGNTMRVVAVALREGTLPVFVSLTLLLALAGLTEELLFRGYIQSRLRQRFPAGVAVIVAAGLFGLAHFDPVHSTLTLCIGIALGAAAEISGSIRPAVLAHCENNVFAAYGARFLAGTWYASAHVPVLLGSVVALAVGAAWLARGQALSSES